MSKSPDVLTGDQAAAMTIDDWRPVYGSLQTRYRTGNFAQGLALVNAIAAAADEAGHHPDIDLRWSVLNIALTTHEAGGRITSRDVELARTISALAAEQGVAAEPGAVSRVELALDTWDVDSVRPFWSAVYGVADGGPGAHDVVDAEGANPAIWFQPTDEHAEPRQRFHLDIRVPPEVADERIAAAVTAGGTVVSNDSAPRFTVLADPQGNKVCICTYVGRTD